MDKVAIDVVLLPDEIMMDKAIKANAELLEKISKKIVLNKEKCLPHISLAMGCIEEGHINAISKVLAAIADENPIAKLKVTGILTSVNARGEKVSVFEIERTEQLQLLHEKVMKKLTPYFSYDVTREMIYGDEEVAETTLLWIKNYPVKASYKNFSPHITIGYGEIQNYSFPIEFFASKLALCHLGNHCTCRQLLCSVYIVHR